MKSSTIHKSKYIVKQTLGDINAFQKGTLGKRIEGRFVGRIITLFVKNVFKAKK